MNLEEATRVMYREHWHHIRTRFSRHNRLQDWYNFRIDALNTLEINQFANRVFHDQSTVFKLNLSFGFLLRNKKSTKPLKTWISCNSFDRKDQTANGSSIG
jgi:hypothetical protein